jgi:hypothetical protein
MTTEEIFLRGALLKSVHHFGAFQDCKDFVDSSLKEDPQVVLEKFQQLLESQPLDKNVLNTFLQTYFQPAGSDTLRFQVEQSIPDWFQLESQLEDNFSIVNKINEDQRQAVLSWITFLFKAWGSLCL